MSANFDPYYKWLAIPPAEQPPNHYRLLGVSLYESDADVIDVAAERQMTLLRSMQMGQHAALSQKLLNEVARARTCLLDVERRAEYDAELRRELDAQQAQPANGTGAKEHPVAPASTPPAPSSAAATPQLVRLEPAAQLQQLPQNGGLSPVSSATGAVQAAYPAQAAASHPQQYAPAAWAAPNQGAGAWLPLAIAGGVLLAVVGIVLLVVLAASFTRENSGGNGTIAESSPPSTSNENTGVDAPAAPVPTPNGSPSGGYSGNPAVSTPDSSSAESKWMLLAASGPPSVPAVSSSGFDSQSTISVRPQKDFQLRDKTKSKAFALSADGRRLATATSNSEFVTIWDTQSGSVLKMFSISDDVEHLCWSSKAEILVALGSNAVVWWDGDYQSGRVKLTSSANAATVSADGSKIALATNRTYQIFDRESGEKEFELPKAGNSLNRQLAFSPDDEILAASNPGELLFAGETTEVSALARNAPDPNSALNATQLAWSPDGKMLAWSDDSTSAIYLMSRPTGETKKISIGNPCKDLVFVASGQVIASVSFNQLSFWAVATGSLLHTIDAKSASVDDRFTNLDASHYGSLLAVQTGNGKVQTFGVSHQRGSTGTVAANDPTPSVDPAAGTPASSNRLRQPNWFLRGSFPADSSSPVFAVSNDSIIGVSQRAGVDYGISFFGTNGDAAGSLKGHSGSLYSLAFSPDKKYFAAAGFGTVYVWVAATGKEHGTSDGYNRVTWIGYTPDSKFLLVADDREIHTIETDTGDHGPPLGIGVVDRLGKIIVSADGKTLAAEIQDNGRAQVCVVDLVTGKLKLVFDSGKPLAISADGSRLAAVGSNRYDVTLRETQSGRLIRSIKSPSSYRSLQCAALHPTEPLLAMGVFGQDFYVMDTETGEMVQKLACYSTGVQSIVFTADGKSMITVARDNYVRVWTPQQAADLTAPKDEPDDDDDQPDPFGRSDKPFGPTPPSSFDR